MSDTQVKFDSLLNNETDSTLKKGNTTTNKKTKTNKNNSVSASSVKTSVQNSSTATVKNSAQKRSTSSKSSTTKNKLQTKSNTLKRVSVTQDDIDKLCEVYDWYLEVKDHLIMKNTIEDAPLNIQKNDGIIKVSKKISATVDNDTWEDFSTLCSNTGNKKGDLLTKIIKDYLIKHKDLF